MAKQKDENIAKFQSDPPEILRWKGQELWQVPRYEVRYFHHKKVEGWSGHVKTKDIKGWVDNVRIALFVEKWKRDHADADPTNEEILDWMLIDTYKEFDLHSLGDSIVKNGVRQAVVLKHDGTLLDGNRRYFASLHKLREAEKKGDVSVVKMVTYLPAFVLSPACSYEDIDAVLVEENFVESCRREWPSFIRANKVFEAYKDMKESGTSKIPAVSKLSERFGMEKSKVERWIKMMNFIEEFHDYHTEDDDEIGRVAKDEYEVKWRSQKYFEYFDELTKTDVVKTLDSDLELKDKVLERLYDEDFQSFKQIRSLPAIASDLRARDKFMLGDGKSAVSEAIDWVTVTGITKKALNVSDRIFSFLKFLGSLTAQDINRMDLETIEALKEMSEKVAEMANSIKGQIKR